MQERQQEPQSPKDNASESILLYTYKPLTLWNIPGAKVLIESSSFRKHEGLWKWHIIVEDYNTDHTKESENKLDFFMFV